jgi:hypothetical protein
MIAASGDLLLGTALLAEGSELHDPAAFTSQVAEFLSRALSANPVVPLELAASAVNTVGLSATE